MKKIVLPARAEKPLLVFTLLTAFIALALIVYSCDKNDHNNDNKAIDMEMVADGFVSPIGTVSAPDNSKRLFVIDQVGKVWIVDKSGNKMATPFIDLTSRIVTLNPNYDERGLLGLAFHPDYKQNGKFYVYYQLPPRAGGPQAGVSWNNLSRISEFKVSSSNNNMADPGSEKILLEIDDPQSNHNGGTLAFGPDGYLYIAIGDGGAANIILVGNFGDGRINSFDENGNFLGQLRAHGNPIVIEGLWGISFAPASATAINPNWLYFAAGPDDEEEGLFGYITK